MRIRRFIVPLALAVFAVLVSKINSTPAYPVRLNAFDNTILSNGRQSEKPLKLTACGSRFSASWTATQMLRQGRETFRFDTFGDEAFWGDTLHLHQAIEGAKFGGVGAGVTRARRWA